LSRDYPRADQDKNQEQEVEKAAQQPSENSLHGAAIIDKDGREVPITESMIVEAFDKIENSDKPQ
jgi:hypothetical protein